MKHYDPANIQMPHAFDPLIEGGWCRWCSCDEAKHAELGKLWDLLALVAALFDELGQTLYDRLAPYRSFTPAAPSAPPSAAPE